MTNEKNELKNQVKNILNKYNSVVEYACNACSSADIIDRIEEELGEIRNRVNLEDEINIIMNDFIVDNMNDDDSEYEDWYTDKIADAVAYFKK